MKNSLLITVILITSLALKAQTYAGLTGGINFSNIKSERSISPDFKNINTFSAGAVIDINISDNLSVRLEPQYIEKGARLNIPGLPAPSFYIHLSYIELPLLFKYSTGKTIKPYIAAGPSIAFNLDSEMGIDLFGFEIMADTDDMTRDINFGLTIGGGFSYETDVITFFAEGRYTHSLNDFTKSGMVRADIGGFSFSTHLNEDLNLKSSGFQLLCGFLLPINE